jgi:3-methylfumaryl-CoA hydratase
MTAFDLRHLQEWESAVGRRLVERQRLEREPLRRYAVAIGDDPEIERRLPALAHWAYFQPLPQDQEIGEDGHPRRGDFLPAVTLPRRMFAAAAMEFGGPLLLDEAAELTSMIADVRHKTGQSGDLIFVEVTRELSQAGDVKVRERQTYVYREDGGPTALPELSSGAIAGDVWQPDAVNLFRFSAATFNGHRIHYDRTYARKVEGYPALIVHGPFTAAKLARLASRSGPLSRFSFRAQAPLFMEQPVYLQTDAGTARAIRCDGVIAMVAEVAHA